MRHGRSAFLYVVGKLHQKNVFVYFMTSLAKQHLEHKKIWFDWRVVQGTGETMKYDSGSLARVSNTFWNVIMAANILSFIMTITR